jgi:hypothetical protein
MINNERKNTMKITNTINDITVEKLPSYTPKYATKHTIYSHLRNKSFGKGGDKPVCKISSVYNGFSNYRTKDIDNYITAFRKDDKKAA